MSAKLIRKSIRDRLQRFAISSLLFVAINAVAEPAMWVIRDKDSTIYMVGTVHLLRHNTDWESARVKKAMAESQELWLEIADGDDQGIVNSLMARYGIDKQKPLSEKLNFVQKAKLSKIAADYDVAMSTLQPLKPWAAAMLFTVLPLQKAGLDPNDGVDQVLKAEAESKHETIRAFETAEAQVRFFANLSESDQLAFLDETLDDADKGIAEMDKLLTAWLNGDTKEISELLNDDMKKESPTLYQTLLVRRNARWADKIEEMLKGSGVQLIAVGAAHLVGPDSVQAQLAQRGIKAESY